MFTRLTREQQLGLLVLLLLAVFFAGYFVQGNFQENGNGFFPGNGNSFEARINIVAVTSQGTGEVNAGLVEIRPGSGRVLVSTNPFVEPDTQFSFETAKAVGAAFAGVDLSNYDVVYSVTDTRSLLVGGASAGAAFGVATVVALQGNSIRSDAAITGSLDGLGRIGPIGGVLEKMIAFGESGGKLFLVPPGQGNLTYFTEEIVGEELQGPYVVKRIRIVGKPLNLNEYAQQNYGMRVIEVATLDEAVGFLTA